LADLGGFACQTESALLEVDAVRFLYTFVACACLFACCDCQGDSINAQKTQHGQGPVPHPWSVHVGKVALSPDGKLALFGYSGGGDGTRFTQWLKLWDIAGAKSIAKLDGFTSCPTFLAFLADGKKAIAGDRAGKIGVYEIPSGRLLSTFRAHTAELQGVALSHDGDLILTAGTDGGEKLAALKIWHLKEGKLIRALANNCQFFDPLAVSPDGRLAVAQCWRNLNAMQINVFDIADGKVLNVLSPKDGWCHPVEFSADSKRALIGKRLPKPGFVALCEIDPCKEIWSYKGGGAGRFLPGERAVLITTGGSKWDKVDSKTGLIDESLSVDFGELDLGDGKKVRVSTVDALSGNANVYLAVGGSNNAPTDRNGLRLPFNLTAKVWRLDEKTPRLVQTWPDPTVPDRN
jgi:WD40 repeat protein